MTDSTHPPRRPFVASTRFWRFGGDFWGVRYEAAFGIHVLDPPWLVKPEVEAGPDRIQVEAREGEGGAVGE